MLNKKFYVFILLVLFLSYILGGIAFKKCYWPFCRNYQEQFISVYKNASLFSGVKDLKTVSRVNLNGKRGVIYWYDYNSVGGMRYGGIQYDSIDDNFIYVDQLGFFSTISLNGSIQYSSKIPPFKFPKSSPLPNFVEVDRLGVRDFYLDSKNNLAILAVSEVGPNSDCHKLVVYENEFLKTKSWVNLYETPCWNWGTTGSIGGAVVKIDDDIYLSIGDNDLFIEPDKTPKNFEAIIERMQLSRILRINRKTRDVKLFAKGFRNPQGLAVNGYGALYEIEHGPQGGDELNIVKSSQDYGYPYVLLGVQYGSDIWPFQNLDKSRGSKPPLYSWIPSIAPSDIEFNINYSPISGQTDCELLISTLKEMSIFFVRLNNQCTTLVNMEKLDVGDRIRKLAISTGNKKRIAFITDGTNRIGLISFD